MSKGSGFQLINDLGIQVVVLRSERSHKPRL